MAYGKIKADAIVYDNSGSDVEVSTADITNKAGTASPAFTGTPTAPTATSATNTTQIATTEFVTSAIADLSDSAPSTLNTLNELAAALGDDANFSTTVTNSIAAKLPLAGGTLTGDVTFGEAISIERVKEKVSISTTAVTGAQEFNAKDQTIVFHNADATGNYTINVRGDSSTTLNSLMDIGQVLTGVFITKYGSTAYYPTAVTVDGSAPSLIRWVGGAPSSAGTASSVCATTFSVIKTADATFTVLASQTEYEA